MKTAPKKDFCSCAPCYVFWYGRLRPTDSWSVLRLKHAAAPFVPDVSITPSDQETKGERAPNACRILKKALWLGRLGETPDINPSTFAGPQRTVGHMLVRQGIQHPLWKHKSALISQVQLGGKCQNLGGGSKYFWFSPWKLGKWSDLTYIFQMGWFNHRLLELVCWPTKMWAID